MMRRTSKQRRSYSLHPELVKYIEKVRREARIGSASAALEQLLWESKRRNERQRQEAQIASYYGSLDEAAREEETEWEKFAETQFPTE